MRRSEAVRSRTRLPLPSAAHFPQGSGDMGIRLDVYDCAHVRLAPRDHSMHQLSEGCLNPPIC
jgi:hypothetical protein